MAEEEDDNLFPEQEDAGLAFRFEIALKGFFLGYWKAIAGATVLVLIGIGGYSAIKDSQINEQKRITKLTVKAESELFFIADDAFAPFLADPDARERQIEQMGLYQSLAMAKSGQLPGMSLSEAQSGEVEAQGDAMLVIGKDNGGPAAVDSLLKAAELFRLVDNNAKRAEALLVAEDKADDNMMYAVQSGLAQIDIEEGRIDEGLGRLQTIGKGDDFLARQATIALAEVYEGLDRNSEAVGVYDDFLSRWPDSSENAKVQERRELAASKG